MRKGKRRKRRKRRRGAIPAVFKINYFALFCYNILKFQKTVWSPKYRYW
jgi:hypothetical protein